MSGRLHRGQSVYVLLAVLILSGWLFHYIYSVKLLQYDLGWDIFIQFFSAPVTRRWNTNTRLSKCSCGNIKKSHPPFRPPAPTVCHYCFGPCVDFIVACCCCSTSIWHIKTVHHSSSTAVLTACSLYITAVPLTAIHKYDIFTWQQLAYSINVQTLSRALLLLYTVACSYS